MPTELPMAEEVSFDHYEVLTRSDGSLHELGRGAMGITYKAFDKNLRVPVALKVINRQNLDNPSARERFVQEARSAAKLRHAHVASVFHLGAEGDTYFYAMEFIDGETVESMVKRRGPLPPVVVMRIALQVARALSAAQQHGLIHRDIKPANLMLLNADGELCVKLIDFGLAMNARPEAAVALTPEGAVKPGGFVGTPHYASPEQLQEMELDIRSDFYSLGATLWYALTASTLFSGSLAKVMRSHLTNDPAWEKLAGVPAPIVALLERLLAKLPDARPQNPAELRHEIEACLEQVENDDPASTEEEKRIAEETQTRRGDLPASDFATRNVIAGRLEVIRQLGETNEGWVFHARDLAAGREVRLLVLRQDFSKTPEAFTLLERDVERLAAAEHPNLLRVYGLETLNELSVVVLEWTEGVTLREVLRSRRELRASEVVALLKQMAPGVDYAAESELRQIDLVLHQVFLHLPGPATLPGTLVQRPLAEWPNFTVKLNPLGITRELAASETWAGGQTMVAEADTAPLASGTLAARYTARLAMLAYELLGGATRPVLAAAGDSTRYTPLANLTEEGNEVMRKALDPARGYAAAGDFLKALLGVGQLEPYGFDSLASRSSAGRSSAGSSLRAPAESRAAPPPARRSKVGILLVALPLVLITGITIYFLTGRTKAPPQVKPRPEIVQTTPNVVPPTPEPTPPPPDPRARLNAAVAEAERIETEKDLGKSIAAWLKVAREFPNAEVGRMRLELLLDGFRLRQQNLTPAEFVRLSGPLQEAARLGVSSAMLLLAESTRETDPPAAFRWYSAAAAKGVPSALTQVGLMYSNGSGVPRDLPKAVEYFEQAADKGDPAAKAALAECLVTGKGVAKDPARAIPLLREAVAKGNVLAMNRLATCYHQGVGVDKDFAEAAQLYEKAADLRHPQAMGNLGVLYMKGQGVPQDTRKAVELFLRGARENDAFCMFLYAQSLEAGMGVAANADEARSWYKRAAELGMPRAAEWCERNQVDFTRHDVAP